MDCKVPKPLKINLVSSTDSPEFTHLSWALTQSSLIGVDAEWKPIRSHQSDFPTVTLLQLGCQLGPRLNSESGELNESVVFLVDLSLIPPSSIWELLKEVFDSPDVLKLGFKFKQDLVYLSSTFCSQGCESGFERVSLESHWLQFYFMFIMRRYLDAWITDIRIGCIIILICISFCWTFQLWISLWMNE